jgi:hypothetical protein
MSCLVLRGATVGATVVMALALGACARDADRSVGTTTITRGVVDPEPVATEPQPASWRLANEICKRRASCEGGDGGGSSVGAVADGACIERERPSAQNVPASRSVSGLCGRRAASRSCQTRRISRSAAPTSPAVPRSRASRSAREPHSSLAAKFC